MRLPGLVIAFLTLLISVLLLSFWLHLLWQDYANIERGSDMLFTSYYVNFLLAAGIFLLLYGLREKYKNQIGFLYMGGSLIKFLVFFIVFYPEYRTDGIVTRSEFGAFFIPYLICLIFETAYASKILLSSPKE
ncbi:hypothetical protein SAMN06265375_101596 [Muriicola jejuensis]|uniref:Uncharacterized protein n=1 Tax=Muriicola jejuensis TaxID=504488 RepID=A0A6P0UF53_9FLAO|nr:DUF6168 family protein [Muriicola jejuensis]NER09883.1 hypothetical protein [Muriicola jejuensis]SMP05068.1 hypothetical protein SAMN06265375_101596 [Muriicola jejuensis]